MHGCRAGLSTRLTRLQPSVPTAQLWDSHSPGSTFNLAIIKIDAALLCRKTLKLTAKIAEAISSDGVTSYGTRIPLKQHNFRLTSEMYNVYKLDNTFFVTCTVQGKTDRDR